MMDNKPQTTKQKEKLVLKKVLLAIVAVFALLGLLLVFLQHVDKATEPDKVDFTSANSEDSSIYFFSVDYSEDPESDPAYMAKQRDVWFTDVTGVSDYLDEGDKNNKDARALMYNYFTALKEGDADAHSALLSEDYKKSFVVQESFTPQKVHDINASYMQSEERDGRYYQYYKVSYEIYENDGTFRNDIGSEVAKLMYFELVHEDGMYKLNSIGYIEIKQ